MEYEKFNEPFEIVRGTEDGRLVEITIRAVGKEAELTYNEIREATRQILEFSKRTSVMRGTGSVLGDTVRSPGGAIYRSGGVVDHMVQAYQRGGGKVTDEYLATLSAAYAQIAPQGRNVSTTLARCLDKPLPTVKGHIMRARNEGFLSAAEEGKEGGEATDKTKKLLAEIDKAS